MSKLERRSSIGGTDVITLTRHLIYMQQKFPEATGDFTLLMASIQLSCKYVSAQVRSAGILNINGLAGGTNTTGDTQKKLDVIADEVFVNALKSSGRVLCMVTEEQEEAIIIHDCKRKGAYAVVFDPLDGSSNIDCGVSIGSIFGIYKVNNPTYTPADALRPGKEMAAAGYCVFGSSTQMVLSFGSGVFAYTLDPTLGEFILTKENLTIKPKASIYSINEGNSIYWDKPTAEYVRSVKEPKDGKAPYSLRYIGSMVADIHRTLFYGGIFMYPGDKKAPNGKLRILYECFPMAYLVEQAGGKATTGKERILDLVPQKIHDRCPVFMGSIEDVEEIERLYRELA